MQSKTIIHDCYIIQFRQNSTVTMTQHVTKNSGNDDKICYTELFGNDDTTCYSELYGNDHTTCYTCTRGHTQWGSQRYTTCTGKIIEFPVVQ